ncbi:c-type cytochrome domain-containing protein [Taibaiella soli]|uniref:Cytochrome C Planctomycete-type domain-containing protein n=1 Tax=Taibaiella soli TaxID=1649169 RepID=A0A2W2A9M0_9BACT|nr:c-type cytochrome domain-containing protein [Taibaiella soli]PZF72075.1 hypothetical protein DN068_14140 [Taibaiella soli]
MYRKILLALSIVAIVFNSCKHEVKTEVTPADGNYPPEVSKIIMNKCATAGCHNAASYQNAGNLLLDTWEHLFNGGSSGAAVVAYSTENSPLLYFINSNQNGNSDIANQPTMPYNGAPLSAAEYTTIKNWIANGAPDKNGNIPFAGNPDTRQKMYLACQGAKACRLVAVIDAEKKVVMRYIKIGEANVEETAHNIRVSPDGRYAYVCFFGGTVIQKIDTRIDSIVGTAHLDTIGQWSVINIAADGKSLMVSNWVGGNSGSLTIVHTETMTADRPLGGFTYPHGVAANPTFDTFYVPAQYGNVVYKFNSDGTYFKQIAIDGKQVNFSTSPGATPNPHDIMMLPDHSKYFLTCENTNEVRVMDAYADTVIKVFQVGTFPQELAVSKSKPYMFVTCQEDQSSYPLSKGSIYVFDYQQLSFVKRIDASFYQPHGIGIDDKNNTFYVASRNFDHNGPAPHHSSVCGAQNGWYQIFDLNTFEPVSGRRYEVTPDPYSFDPRFKP